MDKLISIVSNGVHGADKDKLNIEYYHNSERVTFSVIEDIGNMHPYEKSTKLNHKQLEKFIYKLTKTTEKFREKLDDDTQVRGAISVKERFVKKNSRASLSVWASGGEIGVAVNPNNATCAVMFMTVDKAEDLTMQLIELAELLEGGN
ncbi:hypothetical protein [Bacillus phage Megatron]|uniref:Uncharacterized protein n=5 Tax=Wphvirus megatron TaxID=1987728 RepID=A0A024B2D7_9CAUD|nr:hypothetical protein FP75_gp033 [Bacillus phage Megatron]YP_009211980.1 hypothetical protein QLX47_gp040 [Bacillus phage Eyuki]YP_009279204.1 hypothetical protein BIZ89_gp037 [Bacillus phage Kida]YP_009280841.1 hypothetical protein SAGEFAYGE_38 [Bacillus phage SageFayge]YP_009284980.1 hypothetical protein BIZ88_gp038 [Bacillus phage DirtyBetty]ANI24654.1 hypothetical protein SMUDGE_35 [Bacillus phage Smudge]ASR79251.1 hypothetical protein ZAINNY_38 [Bacillus phage Zainny]QDH49311.1 hypoth